MIKAVFFDLDGTLLPMDQDLFIKLYVGTLATAAAAHGYEPEKMAAAVMAGTRAMMKNCGAMKNEDAFWSAAASVLGERILTDRTLFDEYYLGGGFAAVRPSCGYWPRSRAVIDAVKGKGLRTVLATQPFFPAAATHARIGWAGLDVSDFEYISTFENSSYCKPEPAYYREILDKLALDPTECVMIGNDAEEDMIAATLGMPVFLLTDELLNRKNLNISRYPHGTTAELLEFIDGLN